MKLKHYLFTSTLLSATLHVFGQNVELVHVPGDILQSGHCFEVPTVSQNGDDITVKADTILTDVRIVVKDELGNVVHDSIVELSPWSTTIFVPDSFDCPKATIDIYYRREHLFGILR